MPKKITAFISLVADLYALWQLGSGLVVAGVIPKILTIFVSPLVDVGIGWLIIIGLGLFLIVISILRAIWPKKRTRSEYLISPNAFPENFTNKLIWGRWVGGTSIRALKLLELGSEGRILLFNPNSKNMPNVKNRVDFTASETKSDIWHCSKYALSKKWELKWYPDYYDYTFTIYDPNPIRDEHGEKIPDSPEAYIIKQLNQQGTPVTKREKTLIRNQGADKEKFQILLLEFKKIWSKDSIQITISKDKLIANGEEVEPFKLE